MADRTEKQLRVLRICEILYGITTALMAIVIPILAHRIRPSAPQPVWPGIALIRAEALIGFGLAFALHRSRPWVTKVAAGYAALVLVRKVAVLSMMWPYSRVLARLELLTPLFIGPIVPLSQLVVLGVCGSRLGWWHRPRLVPQDLLNARRASRI